VNNARGHRRRFPQSAWKAFQLCGEYSIEQKSKSIGTPLPRGWRLRDAAIWQRFQNRQRGLTRRARNAMIW
jgi:hypothetical protein